MFYVIIKFRIFTRYVNNFYLHGHLKRKLLTLLCRIYTNYTFRTHSDSFIYDGIRFDGCKCVI